MKTLEQYFRDDIERQAIDHALRARINEKDEVVFYVHPHGVNGDTLDFKVQGNTLIPLNKERIEEAMRQLTSTLREECIETGLITKEQWNEEIAPRLSEVGMAIDDVKITPRTYRIS